MSDQIIENIRIGCKAYRLLKPYVLSFATVKKLDSVQVEITLQNRDKRTAETVPLVGYSTETKEDILKYLNSVKSKLIGKKLADARFLIATDVGQTPFSCSPLLTAIDLFEFDLESKHKEIKFVLPLTSTNTEEIEYTVKAQTRKTLKIKLSGNPQTDNACLEFLETINLAGFTIRFDANQAFNLTSAQQFYKKLSSTNYFNLVDYVEQPLKNDAWSEHGQLVETFPLVKTMLDESIVTKEDLLKAISLKIPFIKLKLFKQGGIKELVEQINIAFNAGLKVVLGNGVATRLSNDLENSIYLKYNDKIFGASEANGFLKLK